MINMDVDISDLVRFLEELAVEGQRMRKDNEHAVCFQSWIEIDKAAIMYALALRIRNLLAAMNRE